MINRHYLSIVVMILLVAGAVRIINLNSNPGWYTDEGTHIEIAKSLMNGENYYFGITDSYLIAARLPLFEHILALWFRLIGVGMFQLRFLTVLISILTASILYRLTYVIFHNRLVGLGVLAIFSIYPQALIYSRFGFSYNLLALLIVLGLYSLLYYDQVSKLQYLVLGCICFALGTISDFIAWSFIPVVIIFILLRYRQHMWLSLLCLGLPFALYAIMELSIHSGIFLHDLTYTLARVGGLPIQQQLQNIVTNIQVLATTSWWIPVGFIGLFLINKPTYRWFIVELFAIPLLISGRTIALYDLSAYYMIPFLPFVALGVIVLIYRFSNILKMFTQIRSSVFVIIVSTIFSLTFIQISSQLQAGFDVGIEHFLINKSEAHDIYDYLIDYTKDPDVIITSPSLGWMFDMNVTDFQIASLINGNSVHFPATLYPERIAFDINYDNAGYAIVDNLWRDWGAVHMPYVASMLDTIQTWDLVYKTSSIQIYQNPKT